MNKTLIAITLSFWPFFSACTFNYSCENAPAPSIPLFLENVALQEVNGKKLSAWSRGAFLSAGKNYLKLTPQTQQSSNNSYEMAITVQDYKEYLLKADPILAKVCLWERSSVTKQPLTDEPITCLNL